MNCELWAAEVPPLFRIENNPTSGDISDVVVGLELEILAFLANIKVELLSISVAAKYAFLCPNAELEETAA